MTPQEHLDHVAADSAHFASASAGNLETHIDHLGWTMRELVAHLGGVYSFVIASITSEGTAAPQVGTEAKAPEGDDINDWFAERRTSLLVALSGAQPDKAVWTFTGTRTVGWWMRRMASETAVHRWDAEAGITLVGDVDPFDSDLAADAIDEYHEVSLRFSSSSPNRTYPAESIHLHRSDGPGEWMLVSDGQGGVAITHEHGKGDAAVRGSASELLLWTWGRPTHDLQIFGDEAVAAAWQALAP
ncbi:MAG: hypothetical protein ACI9BK_000008 [Acidimicrobiales bacterium]